MTDPKSKIITTKFYKKALSHKWWIISIAVVIYLFAIYSATGLQWEEDIMKLLPDKHPDISKYRDLLSQFNPMDAMFIDVAFAEDTPSTEDDLIKVADSLVQIMSASPHFSKITHKWELSELLSAVNILKNHQPVLFTEEDEKIIKEKISLESIRSALLNWKRILAESPAPFLSRKMYSDPLNFDEISINRLNAFQSMSGSIHIHKGRLFTKDGRHILIIAYPKYPATDSQHSRKLTDFMTTAISKFETQEKSRLIDISYLSGHRFSVENANRIKRDIQLTVTISLIAISILSFLVYSRPMLVILTLLPALFGSGIALGMIRWLIPNISAIIIGSGAMLIGIAVDYGIHLLFHADQLSDEDSTDESIFNLINRLAKPLLLGAGTTLIAFLTLHFSILPGYRQLGGFVAIGIVGAVCFVFLIMPLIIPRKKSNRKRKPVIPVIRFFPVFFNWMTKHRLLIFITIVLITLAILPGFLRLQFEGDVQKLNAVSPEIRNDRDNILTSFGDAISSTLVVVEGQNLQEALHQNEILLGQLLNLKNDGLVESFNSVSNLIPSISTQKENKLRWEKFFNDKAVKELENNIDQACSELRIRKELFNDFIKNLQVESDYLQRGDFTGNVLNDILLNQVSDSGDKIFILTNIKIHSQDNFTEIKTRLEGTISGITIYNGKYFVTQMVELIFKELKRIGGIALIFIILLLAVSTRNVRKIFTILLPLFISLFWTFGIMGWFGIKINIINCIISIFIFGLVVDYCIFLVSAYQVQSSDSDEHIMRSGGAITISALTTMFGLGALVLAKHPALHSLGLTALLGIGSGLIAVLLIIPAMSFRKSIDFQ